jgi:hypothetical protein
MQERESGEDEQRRGAQLQADRRDRSVGYQERNRECQLCSQDERRQ